MKASIRLLFVASVVLVCLWPSSGAARPAPANWDALQAAWNAARDREARAAQARDRALAAMRQGEQAALAAADAEVRSRTEQITALRRVEEQIAAAYARVDAATARPQRLLTEKVVLEDWYSTLQPVVAHLTERSFRGAEAELDALAAAGAIEPGPRRFRSYGELRQRIVAVDRALAGQRIAAERVAARERAAIAPLLARRDAILQQLGAPAAGAAAGAERWLGAAGELDRAGTELLDARTEVERAAEALLDASARLRPPILSEVRASVGGTELYSASWRPAGGGSVDERRRAARRAELIALREQFQQMILELTAERRRRHALRLEMAEGMQRISPYLQRSAERYARDRAFQANAALATDIGLTLAEIALTGGAATLQRKAGEVAQQAAARRAGVRAASPLEAAVIREFAHGGEGVSDTLRRAAHLGTEALEAERSAMVRRLMQEGASEVAATTRANALFSPAIAHLQQRERLNRLANEIAAGGLRTDLPQQLLPDLHEAVRMGGEEAALKLAGGLPEAEQILGYWLGRPSANAAAAPRVDTLRTVLMGEAIEFGIGTLANAYRHSSPDMSVLQRFAGMRSNYLSGNAANAAQIGVGLVSSSYEAAIAYQTDRLVNAEADHFAKLMGELNYRYAIYTAQLYADIGVDALLADLHRIRAGLAAAIDQQDQALSLQRTQASSASVPANASLRIELAFSVPLAAAPNATLAGLALPLQPQGGNGTRWQATIPLSRLSSGEHPLSVSLSPAASRHGSLDSDPSTRPERVAGTWRGFETGADTHHAIPLRVAGQVANPGRLTAATPDIPYGPCHGFTGHWSTPYGPMILETVGDRVSGTYGYVHSGAIVGNVSGNVLTGRWQDSSGRGTIELRLAADGRSYSGRALVDDPGTGTAVWAWGGGCETRAP